MILQNLVISLTITLLIIGAMQNSNAILPTTNNCISTESDIDGDGLPNEWEENGIDINSDGIIDLDLPLLGASSTHKDLFLEIDYMQNHKPYSGVDDFVIEAFRNSPQCNPDGIPGTNLHIEIDDEIPHKPSLDLLNPKAQTMKEYVHFSDLDKIKKDFFGTERSKITYQFPKYFSC